ncbi:hypothetical protein EJB05_23997, partial [Eragrostis curvula]
MVSDCAVVRHTQFENPVSATEVDQDKDMILLHDKNYPNILHSSSKLLLSSSPSQTPGTQISRYFHSNNSIYNMDLPENKLREYIHDNGKPMWMAHSNHNLSGRLTSKSDVYSFGVVLLELITRRKALENGKISLVENFIKAQAKQKKIREFFDGKIADESNLRILDRVGKLAAKCLQMDMDKRPEMKDVVERLRMLRKDQYQAQEKIALFDWVLRRKPAAQNIIPIEKMGEVRRINRSIRPLRKTELDEILRASAEPLGEGKYGTTFKAMLENGSVLTVKRAKGEVVPESVFKERIEAIGAIEHELIVPLRGYYFSSEEQLLLYDYMENGSLFSNLHGRILGSSINNVKPISWEARSAIALSTARAVAYIHSTNRTASHGSINSSNVLLTESYEARMADVYSFGVLLLELLTGKSPVPSSVYIEGTDLVRMITVLVPKEIQAEEVFDQELLADDSVVKEMLKFFHLAVLCCNKNPDMRPRMSEVASVIEEMRSSSSTGGRQAMGSNAGRRGPIFEPR